MQAHNYQKKPKGLFGGLLQRWYKTRRYMQLAGLIMVSQSLIDTFRQTYPDVDVPLYCAHNGLDLSSWNPQPLRVNEVLFVGRLAQEKGVFQAAEAMARLLPDFPEWRTRFIVSTMDGHQGFATRLDAILGPLRNQAVVQHDRPFAEVQRAMESASIVLVPSVYQEPFGRTAIEAFAGGAALISSTNGGLREVIGTAAIPLAEITVDAIAEATRGLLADPARRMALAAAGQGRVAACFTIQNNAAAIDGAVSQTLLKMPS